MPTVKIKEKSKEDFTVDLKGENLTTEIITLGAVLRIADSLERLEKPYVELLKKAERDEVYKRELRESNQSLANSIRTYKGEITKLKKKIAELERK